MSDSFLFMPRPASVTGAGTAIASPPTNVIVQVQVCKPSTKALPSST